MRIRNIKNADEIINGSKEIILKPEDYKNKWNLLFNNDSPIHLEIGMGKGNFIIDMALNNPDINFIGLEKYTSVIVRAIKKLEGKNIPNLKLINGDALNLSNYFGKEISRIYLNFSDPWPKKRTAKRRLTSEVFLRIYDDIFKNDADIMQKTDNQGLFESSIISLSNYGYVFEDISLDLWSTDKTYSETEYEHKFKNQGIKIKYLKAIKKVSKID
jgi:tRNA (guanine-N7-)-methyltransferase